MRGSLRASLLGLLAAAAVLGGATASAEEWFDAYEAGLEALGRRQGARAAELLERSIRKHPEPGENLLTYGTNRVEKYHPYLRLAEAQLMAGRPEAAAQALKVSLQKGKEPAEERDRLTAAVEAGLREVRSAAATPPPATVGAAAAVLPSPTAVPAPIPTAADVVRLNPSPAAGTLGVESNPAAAAVYIDGVLVGETPLRLEKAPGEYRIKIRHDGYLEQSFTARVMAGGTQRLTRTLTPLAAPSSPPTLAAFDPASFVVYTEPPGASIYVDDEPVGNTDPVSGRLVKTGITPGTHRARASHPDWQDATWSGQVGARGPTQVRLELSPKAERRLPVGRLAGLTVAVLVLASAAVVLVKRRRRQPGPPTVALAPAASVRPLTPGRAVTPRARRLPSTPARTPGGPTLLDAPTSPNRETGVLEASSEDGEFFGEFLLLEPLGKGGMAQVFLAERNGELFALKRPLAALLEDPEFLERFLREAEIGRALHHPNIIRIFERGEVEGVPFFTMEVVKGRTLQEILRVEQSFPPPWAAELVAQVAEALDYAHLKGIVHRDLKPSNIMVLDDGAVKVMDYGIARARHFEGLTLTGSFLGTPDYGAPETAEGKGADARSDLYSLGVVFYEILTGRKPFQGDTPFSTLRKHCTELPTPPSQVVASIPAELEAIVLKLLEKAPEHRYAQAEDLLNDLRAFLNRRPGPAAQAGAVPQG